MYETNLDDITNTCREDLEYMAQGQLEHSSNFSVTYTWMDRYLQPFFRDKKKFEILAFPTEKQLTTEKILALLSTYQPMFQCNQWFRIYLKSGYTYLKTGSYEKASEAFKEMIAIDDIPSEIKGLILYIPQKFADLHKLKYELGKDLYRKTEIRKHLQKSLENYIIKYNKLPNSLTTCFAEKGLSAFPEISLNTLTLACGEMVTHEALKRKNLVITRRKAISSVVSYMVNDFEQPSDIIGELHVRVPRQKTKSI